MSLFEGTIEAGDFRSILDSSTVVYEEARVFFEDNKVKVRVTDPSGVGVVVLEISETAFDDCEIGSGNICCDFSEITDMIKMADGSTDVNLKVQEHELIIDFLDLQFTVKLIDPDTLNKDTKKPDIDLDGEVVLDSSAFKRGVNAAELVADHVELGVDDEEDAFYMKAKGDINKVILKRRKKDLVTIDLEPVSSTFSVECLKNICGAIPDETQISVNLGEDFPSEISYSIIEEAVDVTYFLAPRIQPNSQKNQAANQ